MKGSAVMASIDRAIKEEIRNLGQHFRENELAYLSLTGKIETPLRDKLAFSLNKRLGRYRLTARREWKRVDLAILGGKETRLALVECKAMATFDCTRAPRKAREYPGLMYKDLRKIRRLAKKGTSLYAILFAVHPLNPVPDYVKYFTGMNRAFARYGKPGTVLKICDRTIRRFFQAKGLRASLCTLLDAGACFGVSVEVPCWIVGPLKKAQLAKH